MGILGQLLNTVSNAIPFGGGQGFQPPSPFGGGFPFGGPPGPPPKFGGAPYPQPPPKFGGQPYPQRQQGSPNMGAQRPAFGGEGFVQPTPYQQNPFQNGANFFGPMASRNGVGHPPALGRWSVPGQQMEGAMAPGSTDRSSGAGKLGPQGQQTWQSGGVGTGIFGPATYQANPMATTANPMWRRQ